MFGCSGLLPALWSSYQPPILTTLVVSSILKRKDPRLGEVNLHRISHQSWILGSLLISSL